MKRFFKIYLLLLIGMMTLQAQSLRVELKELFENPLKYKIIDVRDEGIYSLVHLPNALNLPAHLTYHNQSIDGRITEPTKMQKIIRELGLDVEDHIVIYDDGTIFDASRVFWALEVYGFKNLKLLNGGYEQWKKLGYPLSFKEPTVNPSSYIATIDNKRLATKFTTQIATKNPNQVIIDARKYNAYIGKESSAQRFGHIPKAIHIPAIHNLNEEQQKSVLKSTEQLRDLYKDIKKDQKVVIYCAIGKIASTNYFALRELGYDVANYDASWREWGNDFSLPIETKSQK